jgi:DNA-binding NarL/FixJ family response regulator
MTAPDRDCRVFICDDQPLVREAVSEALAGMPGFLKVGEAANGSDCLAGLNGARPDLLIIDINMPQGGPELASAAKQGMPDLTIVVFSAHRNANLEAQMRSAGADEYVVKTGRLRPLREALDRARAAKLLASPDT